MSVRHSPKYSIMKHIINTVVNNLNMSNILAASAIHHVLDGDLDHIYDGEICRDLLQHLCYN